MASSPIPQTKLPSDELAKTTTEFETPVCLPDTTYRAGVLYNSTGFTRFYGLLHFIQCLTWWFIPCFMPAIMILLAIFQYWFTLVFLICLSIYPILFPLKRALWYRRLILKTGEPLAQWTKGFHIWYQHGAYEFLNRHRRADYLQYDIDRFDAEVAANPKQIQRPNDKKLCLPTQSETDMIYPADQFTIDYSTKYDTINNNQTWKTQPYEQFSQKEQEYLKKPYIISAHPHGCFCVSYHFGGINNKTLDNINDDIQWLLADILTRLPLFRYIEDWYGKLRSASASSMKKLMSEKKDLSICPGGFEEAGMFEYGKYNIYIKKRQGFIKYALQYGYNVVPMFAFGEEQTYFNYNAPWFVPIRKFLSKYSIPTIMPFGRSFLTPLLPMTDHYEMHVVYGKPLFLPHIENPNVEQVNYWHARYISQLEELFHENIKKFKLDERKDVDNTLHSLD